ncbi:MAG: hypothetical protein AB8H47_23535 [Bacteroidia bacterium]
MQTTDNKYRTQMKLAGSVEWVRTGSNWRGAEVLSGPNQARVEWFSDCEKERSSSADLMKAVSSLSNLTRACRRVIRNGGQGGVDGMGIGELSGWLNSNWRQLQLALISGDYVPDSVWAK